MRFGYEGAPREWPSLWRWLGIARADALGLFPRKVYEDQWVEHSILGRRIIVVSDPRSIDHVFGAASKRYELAPLHLRMLRPALGDGLIVAQGRAWALQRRLASQLVPRRLDERRIETIEQSIQRTLDPWIVQSRTAGMSSRRLLDDLMALSMDLISKAVFKYDNPVADQRIVERVNAHRGIIERPDIFDLAGLPEGVPSWRMMRAHKVAHSADHIIERHIGVAAAAGSAVDKVEDVGARRRDFVVSMITGFESVTTTVTWMLAVLASMPDLQESLRDEARHVDATEVSGWPEACSSRLDAAIREVLRLFPPLPLVFRRAKEDDLAPTGAISRGSTVCMSPWIVHRHRRLWEQPDVFDLSRHLRPLDRPDAYIPFGVGARRCVGMYIGFNLVKQILATILGQCRLSFDGLAKMPAPRAGVSLRPSTEFRLSFLPIGGQ